MVINSNIQAISAHRRLMGTDRRFSKTIEKLSSGRRINRAADDAAGLAVSQHMQTMLRSTGQALRNARDGISLLQRAEGALQELNCVFSRLRELSLQALNDVFTDEERTKLQLEVEQLLGGVDQIIRSTEFNRKLLFDGSCAGSPLHIVTCVSSGSENQMTLSLNNMTVSGLGLVDASGILVSVSTHLQAETTLMKLDDVINKIGRERAVLGAWQNRLDRTIVTLRTGMETLTAAESRVRDVDFSLELAAYTKHQVFMQSGTAALLHAQSKQEAFLELLA